MCENMTFKIIHHESKMGKGGLKIKRKKAVRY